MNWTGGQLHRSAHQGTLSKTQRQNFAKSRQLAIDRVSRHPSPIRGFPSLGKRGEQVACKDNQKEQAVVAEEQTQSVSSHRLLHYYSVAMRHCFEIFLVLTNP